ncbi:DUF2017 domain-containing protein [Calidifontibacter sp. DB0510]|uniref:DUF2017 domain-containing protein n=1 Tax=Metallococcus carri TaxID=1656884 RepID=A0A967AXZ5_9MICO|nr:DUF2017 family protein [Metallococcus carri]NHN54489.1 DUF2017 domain-containing protein [Metallococcus carri]NOP36672.1 DUF2017 family protein [Calidifontibacter sp. DB2511S]
MAEAFRRKGDQILGRMAAEERAVVIDLLEQTAEVLAPPQRAETGDAFTDLVASMGEKHDPEEVAERDPVLRRLLPDGHREDSEAAREFRDATEGSLRRQKSELLHRAIDALSGIPEKDDKVRLTTEEAVALMRGLADVRLALGERLELRTDEDSEELHRRLMTAPDVPDDPRLVLGLYYDFLTWLQESLTLALMPR